MSAFRFKKQPIKSLSSIQAHFARIF